MREIYLVYNSFDWNNYSGILFGVELGGRKRYTWWIGKLHACR